jgi:hypothetical protein
LHRFSTALNWQPMAQRFKRATNQRKRVVEMAKDSQFIATGPAPDGIGFETYGGGFDTGGWFAGDQIGVRGTASGRGGNGVAGYGAGYTNASGVAGFGGNEEFEGQGGGTGVFGQGGAPINPELAPGGPGVSGIGAWAVAGVVGQGGGGNSDGVQGHGTGVYSGVVGWADPDSDVGPGTGVVGFGASGGFGVRGIGSGGNNTAPIGNPVGVYGQAGGGNADGVQGRGSGGYSGVAGFGDPNSTLGPGTGVFGQGASGGPGVRGIGDGGENTGADQPVGVYGQGAPGNPGAIGQAGDGDADGVQGASSGSGFGVSGWADENSANPGAGVYGFGAMGPGVWGHAGTTPRTNIDLPVGVYGLGGENNAGVYGQGGFAGPGVIGVGDGANQPVPASQVGVYGQGGADSAGVFGQGAESTAGVIGQGGGYQADGVVGQCAGAAAGVTGFGDPTFIEEPSVGVFGQGASYGAGVWGIGAGGPPRGFGEGGNLAGVYGVGGLGPGNYGGPGVIGIGYGAPVSQGPGGPAGVFGQAAGQNPGVMGVGDLWGVIGSATDAGVGVFGQATALSGIGVQGWAFAPATIAGSFQGTVVVTGDLNVGGAKSAVVPFADGSHRRLYCMESPESWFEDFGTGELAGGRAEVRLDPDFAATVDTTDYHVFLTEYDDNNALYVTERSATGFAVRAKASDTASATFSYRVVAKRVDIEAPRLEKVTMPTMEVDPKTFAVVDTARATVP